MRIDEGLRSMERTMDIPVTSLPWLDTGAVGEWPEVVCALGDYMRARAKGGSTIIFMPSTGYGSSCDGAKYWRMAKAALDFVVASSAPCEQHILRGRIMDVLEHRLPGQDEVHTEVIDRFNEAMHKVTMHEMAGD